VPRQGLDTARVVQEAARIADADGLAEVTLARVAVALGVRAPSLYNHVDGREGLLRLLALRSIFELGDALRDAAVGKAGEDALAAIAHAYRSYALEHPGGYAATVRAPGRGDEELAAVARRTVEVMVSVLAGWGLAGDAAMQRVRVIRAALHGFVAIEADGGFGLPLDLDESFELLISTLVAGLEASADPSRLGLVPPAPHTRG
jgi:AcrR family transcriptional regulator